jgi:hypothetical protein
MDINPKFIVVNFEGNTLFLEFIEKILHLGIPFEAIPKESIFEGYKFYTWEVTIGYMEEIRKILSEES